MQLSLPALAGTASIAFAAAGFYYTTQRSDLLDLTRERIPVREDLRSKLRRRLVGQLWICAAVIALHMPLTILFLLGATEAIGSALVHDGPVDPVRVSVAIVAGVALLHLSILASDTISLVKRLSLLAQGPR